MPNTVYSHSDWAKTGMSYGFIYQDNINNRLEIRIRITHWWLSGYYNNGGNSRCNVTTYKTTEDMNYFYHGFYPVMNI